MRFTRHVVNQLAAYADGQLASADASAVAEHLAVCPACRMALADVRFAAGAVRRLGVMAPPDSVWASIEAMRGEALPRAAWGPSLRTAAAWAMVAIVTGAALAWWIGGVPDGPWRVERSDAASAVRMAAGEWVETDAASRARIVVGDIGTVDLSPQTQVRLGSVSTSEYRMALTRGTLNAVIAAPPRVFFVETPASTIVDLGCAYTVTVDEGGTGMLRVTEGWAALEWRGRASIVPAGARALMHGGAGPGTPYFEDAAPSLVNAVMALDLGDAGAPALQVVLAQSRVRDTLTLWHLLSRVDGGDRTAVYDRIAELTPPPPQVSRERILQLDADDLRAWREELAWKW